jgi:hypothetical protein
MLDGRRVGSRRQCERENGEWFIEKKSVPYIVCAKKGKATQEEKDGVMRLRVTERPDDEASVVDPL